MVRRLEMCRMLSGGSLQLLCYRKSSAMTSLFDANAPKKKHISYLYIRKKFRAWLKSVFLVELYIYTSINLALTFSIYILAWSRICEIQLDHTGHLRCFCVILHATKRKSHSLDSMLSCSKEGCRTFQLNGCTSWNANSNIYLLKTSWCIIRDRNWYQYALSVQPTIRQMICLPQIEK